MQRIMIRPATTCALATGARYYGNRGGGDFGGGKGMKGGKGMDMYGGKGMDMDMYGGKGMKGGKGMDMDMYGGKGGKGMDMYGGKGMDMDMYGGKGMKGGKGMDMDMYGGKGGKGSMDMEMYGGKGGKGMDMYGGMGGKGMPPAMEKSQPLPPPTGGPLPSSLQLNFPYPGGGMPELQMFDVRDEVCRSMGFLHGQKLRVTNPQNPEEMFEMVVVGVARDPATGEPSMWFHIAGEPGAGMFQNEMLDAYREFMEVVGKVKLNPLTAPEQQQLKEHVKMCKRIDRSQMNIECFNSWHMSRGLRKIWQPPATKKAPWPPQCDFGYAMDTGSEEAKAVWATFDKRNEVLKHFEVQNGVQLQHGMTLTVADPKKPSEGAKDYVVIGSRPMPGVRYVLWAHCATHAGARPISVRLLKTATIKNTPPVAVETRDPKDFEEQEDEIEARQFEAFERFISRAERAVVRKITKKKKKGKDKNKDKGKKKEDGAAGEKDAGEKKEAGTGQEKVDTKSA